MAKGTVAHRNRLRMAWELAKIALGRDDAGNKKPSMPLQYVAASFLIESELPATMNGSEAEPAGVLEGELFGAFVKVPRAEGPPFASGKTWYINNNKNIANNKDTFASLNAMSWALGNKEDVVQPGDRILFVKSATPYDNLSSTGTPGTCYFRMPLLGNAQPIHGLPDRAEHERADALPDRPQDYSHHADEPHRVMPHWPQLQPAYAPVIVEAEDGAVIWIGGNPNPKPAPGFWIGVGYQGLGPGITAVPLILRNLVIMGSRPPLRQGDPDARANGLFAISSCENVTIENCIFVGSEDILDSGGLKAPAGVEDVQISNVTNGRVVNSVFDSCTNIDLHDEIGKPRWMNTFGGGTDTVVLRNCSNLTFEGCFFGSCSHMSLLPRSCGDITIRRSFFRNRLHTSLGVDGERQTVEQCVFAGSGQRSVGQSDSLMLEVGGRNHVMAFNVLCADPEADDWADEPDKLHPVGYYADVGIGFVGRPHTPCLDGYERRCVEPQMLWPFAKWVKTWAPPSPDVEDALTNPTLMSQLQAPPKLACRDGKPPSQPQDCGAEGGLSKLGGWCRQGSQTPRKLVCAQDLAEPDCVGGLTRVCVAPSWNNTIFDFVAHPEKLQWPGDSRAFPDDPFFGVADVSFGHVVLNNLFLDMGASAISISSSPPPKQDAFTGNSLNTSEGAVRDVLVMNNVILGQRRDPTAILAKSFYSNYYKESDGPPDENGHLFLKDGDGDFVNKNGKKIKTDGGAKVISNTLLSLPSPSVALGYGDHNGAYENFSDAALLDIDIAGQREGFAGNLFAFNVIGRRDEVPLYADSQPSTWWTNPKVPTDKDGGKTCSSMNECGAVELLTNMALHGFNNGDASGNQYKTAQSLPNAGFKAGDIPVGKLRLMSWSALGPPALPQPLLSVKGAAAFATDFAVALPSVFDAVFVGHRWASIADLNDAMPYQLDGMWKSYETFGESNLTTRNLVAPGGSTGVVPNSVVIPAWPLPATAPRITYQGWAGTSPAWYPDLVPGAAALMPMSDIPSPKNPGAAVKRRAVLAAKWPHAIKYAVNAVDLLGNSLSNFAPFRGPVQP